MFLPKLSTFFIAPVFDKLEFFIQLYDGLGMIALIVPLLVKFRSAFCLHIYFQEIRQANKQLLGKLYTDQLYLERLLENPVINHVSLGEEKIDIVQKRVKFGLGLDFFNIQ